MQVTIQVSITAADGSESEDLDLALDEWVGEIPDAVWLGDDEFQVEITSIKH
jgi:hypothetical protein